MHHVRGGPGQERCGITQARSGRGLEFAARSGSRCDNRQAHCGDTVSANAPCQKRGTARLSRSRTKGPSPHARIAAAQPCIALRVVNANVGEQPSPSQPYHALGHSPHAFDRARTSGSQAPALTPLMGRSEGPDVVFNSPSQCDRVSNVPYGASCGSTSLSPTTTIDWSFGAKYLRAIACTCAALTASIFGT
jgi:hypothetical protein